MYICVCVCVYMYTVLYITGHMLLSRWETTYDEKNYDNTSTDNNLPSINWSSKDSQTEITA